MFVRYECSRSLLYKLWPRLKRCLFPLVPFVCFDSVSLSLEPISPKERALPPGLCRLLRLAGFPCIHMCCEPCAHPNSRLPGSGEGRVHHGLGTKLSLYCRRAQLTAARRVLSACAARRLRDAAGCAHRAGCGGLEALQHGVVLGQHPVPRRVAREGIHSAAVVCQEPAEGRCLLRHYTC